MRFRRRPVAVAGAEGDDALRDLKRLWAALHAYLVAQGSGDSEQLTGAYLVMVDEHNAVWARHVRQDERAPKLEGVS